MIKKSTALMFTNNMQTNFSISASLRTCCKLCLVFFAFLFYSECRAQITINIKNSSFPSSISLDAFCEAEPQVLEQFFNEINLELPGLESTRQAVNTRSWAKAGKLLIDYYRIKQKNDWLIKSGDVLDTNSFKVAEDALADKFTFQGVEGKVKRLENGRIIWSYNGPNKDIEWAFFLNRHFFLNDLAHIWLKNKEAKYARLCNDILFDWILSNPVAARYAESAAWRPLEAGIRSGRSWIKTFYHLQNAPEFTDVTRLLMLISFFDHADYLQKFHGRHHNHAVSELISLCEMSLNFPEFKKADLWYKSSVKNMQEEFVYSAYPDGAIKELTNHYHQVVAREFTEFIDVNKFFAKQLDPLFSNVVESIDNYTAYTARPDGIGLNNNDADVVNNFEVIRKANFRFKRADWEYIISNGKKGKAPQQTSVMFPWAGHFIMRNGYGEQPQKAQYAYFDMGPWGTTHQHNDKLHLSIYAYGREFLCDNGRMYYKGDSIKSYFNLSVGHNVITIDDKGQNETSPENKKPVDSSNYSIQPAADFAISTYGDGYGDKSRNAKSYSPNKSGETIPAKHTRAVIYLKNRYWIVVDRVDADKPRRLTAYWHFNPSCEVRATGETVSTTDAGKSNLKIFPVGTLPWNVSLVKGQDSLYVQGWYSNTYNNRMPAYCAEYRTTAAQTAETFAWVMYPSGNTSFPVVRAHVLDSSQGSYHFQIDIAGEAPLEVAINLDKIKPIILSDKSIFTGRCVIIQKSKKPIVIHGTLADKKGKIIAENK